MLNPNKIILTGSPGTGKTSSLNELRSRGFHCLDEPARIVIAEQRREGGLALPELNPELFVDKLLETAIRAYAGADPKTISIFDRGIPDTLAYARCFGTPDEKLWAACHHYPYSRRVFFFEPWKEIYKNDAERKMTFEASLRFSNDLVDAYESLGYELVVVPNLSVGERADWIIKKLVTH